MSDEPEDESDGLAGFWYFRRHPSLSRAPRPDVCLRFDDKRFPGVVIPDRFPNYELYTEDILFARVHINCKCTLERTKTEKPLKRGLGFRLKQQWTQPQQ